MPAKRAVQQESSSDDDARESGEAMPTNAHKYLDVQYSKKFMASLPKKIQQRAEVLMNYHAEYLKLQEAMERRETELRRKYDALYAPIYQRRQEIITGTGEPITEIEVQKGFPVEHASKVSLDGTEGESEAGLPGFWLRVLQHNVVLNSMIEPHDTEVLKHLIDVSSRVIEEGSYGSFAVTFKFAPNDYLVENACTLTVLIHDDEATIQRTPLTWKPGKNVTVKKVTKKQRSKRTHEVRTITTEEDQPSFFTIFRAPEKDAEKGAKKAPNKKHDDDEDEEDEESEDGDEELVNLLQLLHNSIIPGAVNYYTGEAADGSSDVEDDEEEEDEEESDDEVVNQHLMRATNMRRGGRA